MMLATLSASDLVELLIVGRGAEEFVHDAEKGLFLTRD